MIDTEQLHGEGYDADTDVVLQEILDQEITPELIPTAEGASPQATEDFVGPYALQDFTLFHVLRRGYRPSKIAFLAVARVAGRGRGRLAAGLSRRTRRASYDLATIRKWLEVFLRRFFANQFKRSALPNGPKVSAGGTMSPRGDWRMPSDASAAAWLAELENVPEGVPESVIEPLRPPCCGTRWRAAPSRGSTASGRARRCPARWRP